VRKPFFVHGHHVPRRNHPCWHPKGFTAYVSFGSTDDKVKLSATFCSPKDNFSKKLGRENALVAEVVEVNKSDIPRIMAALAGHCRLPNQYDYLDKYLHELTHAGA
jgi:hypothetical protein